MRLIDADDLKDSINISTSYYSRVLSEEYNKAYAIAEEEMNELKKWIDDRPTVEVIPKDNVYKAIQEMMKYEHEGFINISLVRLEEILKKCGVSEDGNN